MNNIFFFGKYKNKLIAEVGRDYLYILISSVVTALASFLLIKLLQQKFSKEEFNSVVLMMRYAGTAVPLLVMGMGVATPRYIGLIHDESYRLIKVHSIVSTALIIVSITILLYSFLSWLLYKNIDDLIFEGMRAYQYAGLYFVSMAIYAFSYSVLRGMESFVRASWIDILVRVITPFTCLYAFNNYKQYVFGMSIVALTIGFYTISIHIMRKRPKFELSVLHFGMGRVVGDILYPLIFTIPVIYTLNTSGGDVAAKISIGIMVANVFLMPVSPISVLMLPKVGRVFKHSENKNKRLGLLLRFSMVVAAVLTVLYLAFARFAWSLFGYDFDGDYYLFGGILYFNVVFIVCRSVLDGLYSEPYLFKFFILTLSVEIIGVLIIYFQNSHGMILIPVLVAFAVLVFLVIRQLFIEKKRPVEIGGAS